MEMPAVGLTLAIWDDVGWCLDSQHALQRPRDLCPQLSNLNYIE